MLVPNLLLVTFYFIMCQITLRIVSASGPLRAKRTIVGQYPHCPVGCTSCSAYNGCITCSQNFYLLLTRRGMRHTGTCTHTCPAGFYGVRRQSYSQCFRCNIENCEACFSRSYCTRCATPYIAYRGECVEQCPDGLHYADYSKDCRESVDCMVGPWAPWGSCMRDGQTCGFKYGITTRTRSILESPSLNGARCPSLTENKCCRMQMRHCADLINNNSDLTNEVNQIEPSLSKRRHRKKKRKRRKQRKRRKNRKNRKHRRRSRKDKNKKKFKKRNKKRAWGRICRRNVVFNDINSNLFERNCDDCLCLGNHVLC